MRISDWSSDVCSSDLLPWRIAASGAPVTTEKFQHWLLNDEGARITTSSISAISAFGTGLSTKPRIERRPTTTDRKSVVSGKSVSVRVGLGGSRIIKKKKQTNTAIKTIQTLKKT